MPRTTKTLHFKAQPVNDKQVNEAQLVAFYPANDLLQASYSASAPYSLSAIVALASSFALAICSTLLVGFALAVYNALAVYSALADFTALAVSAAINRAGVVNIVKTGALESEQLRFEICDNSPVRKLFNSCLHSLKALFNQWRSIRPLSYKGETYASIS